MPQEDYLKRQLDQFTKALAALLGRLIGLKNDDAITQDKAISMLAEVLVREKNISLEQLLKKNDTDFIETLTASGFREDDLESLSEIFYTAAGGEPTGKPLLEKSLLLLTHLNTSGSTYSLERHYRIQEIRKLLQ